MKKFTLSLLCTLCISGNLFAAASDSPKAIATKLSKEMIKGKPLSPEMQKQLTIISFTHPDAVKTPLVKIKFTGSDQESAQAKKALNIIKRSELFQTKQSVCGMTIGWYLLFQNGQLTSIPLITKVKKGSVAEKAHILSGDVIESCAGIDLMGENSRNKFTQFLAQWPESIPLSLNVKRSRSKKSSNTDRKLIKKQLTLYAKN